MADGVDRIGLVGFVPSHGAAFESRMEWRLLILDFRNAVCEKFWVLATWKKSAIELGFWAIYTLTLSRHAVFWNFSWFVLKSAIFTPAQRSFAKKKGCSNILFAFGPPQHYWRVPTTFSFAIRKGIRRIRRGMAATGSECKALAES